MKKKNYFKKMKGIGRTCLLFAALFTSFFVKAQPDLNLGLKLHYTFESATGTTVSDVTGNGYDGTLYGATVGLSNGKNSLLLSTSGTDYLDMGLNTGNLVSSLTDFSLCCYVWVNSTYATLSNNGNMIASFSNSLNSGTDKKGYMYLQAKRSYFGITTTDYNAETNVGTGADVVKGKWVQMTYTQSGTTGKLYQNGVLVSTNSSVPLTPSSLGTTAYNVIAKAIYAGDLNLSDTQISDFRIYNRAVTSDEVLLLNGYPTDFVTAYDALTLGDVSAVTSNLTLPATIGTSNIPVIWTSSLPLIITTTGAVTRPSQYDATVKLIATLTEISGGVTYTLTKEFDVTVKALTAASDQLAEWDFAGNTITQNSNGVVTVKDEQSGFVGIVMNNARIRTIGKSTQYNVLDLGNGTGYFDMGTDIGKAIYSLKNYSMLGYFRVDNANTTLSNNGNFLWTFSNSDKSDIDQNGYVFGSLKTQNQACSTNYWALGDQEIGLGKPAPKGAWHQFVYTQQGDTGTVYIDGASVKTGTMTNIPSTAITIAGRTGTLFNWLGRSCYNGDSYLQKTLVYDFQLLGVALSSDDINLGFGNSPVGVSAMLDNLNTAYSEDSDYVLPALTAEQTNLTLGDLSAVKANIPLPLKGQLDPTITITWKTTLPQLIDSVGNVTRPDFYNYNDTLTASLTKNGQKLTKAFPATVIVKDGTQFANNLLVKYDFSSVADSVVTDAAEQHLSGVLKNYASVKTIGTTTKFNVLNLGDSIGYFDMGTKIGKIMYHLNDFTIGAYFKIDSTYKKLGKNGNMLWSFSNAQDILTNAKGYLLASLRNQAATISFSNWTTEQTTQYSDSASKSSWHHFAYTQNGIIGALYLDGMKMKSDTITSLPSIALPKPGQLGTLFNWIGRSCYGTDVYLRKSQVYDFRLYNTALTDDQVMNSVLNVANTIPALDAASAETPSAVKTVTDSPYKVLSSVGEIIIQGLKGGEKVSVFDITGRQLTVNKPSIIAAKAGVYIVRINESISKVVVR
jgi:hypothetical protein